MRYLFQFIFIFYLGLLSNLYSCSKDKVTPPDKEQVLPEKEKEDPPLPDVPDEPEGLLVSTEEELKTAIAQAAPGDLILMQDGNWKDLNIIFKGTGTPEKPITLRAQTGGQVVLSGNSSLRMSGEYLVVDGLHFKDGETSLGYLIQFRDEKHQHAHHSRITNIVVSEFNRTVDDGSDVWVNLFGTHNRVDHCYFHGKRSSGRIMTVWRSTDAADYHQIDHNHFKDVPVLGQNGAEAIGIGASNTSLSDSYTTIEYNIFENCNGEGELLSIKSGQNTIRYNTVIESQGSISLRHGNNNRVEGNFILGGQVRLTGGIRIMGEGHIIKNNYIQGLRGTRAALSLIEGLEDSPLHGYLQIKNVLIAGNTLVDNEVNMVIGDLYNVTSGQIMPVIYSLMKNNVIVGMNTMSNLIRVLDESTDMAYEDNVVHHGVLNITDKPGIRVEDPHLQIGADGLYHYEEDSPFKENIVGQPLDRSEVGPDWMSIP
ncbi:hypothetical protein G5B00_15965 [Parapedobacter sp. SGR-10]|uniref:polysaccharide lyase 6 family protein n=1 Tax=Parapedobacter sp. SGR-10 TaxID=2710879 RepID=UPI0013D1AAB5|nr:polysaccharide lyase 6 family protein [Parapedobacter sp. SGR-10]NGF58013.1 hypothetical protein [Parapedobacter sp. SGR-10]